MRWWVVASFAVAACSGHHADTAPRQHAAVIAAEVPLEMDEPSALPDSDVVVTLVDLQAEEPREELPGGGLVERRRATATLQIRHGDETATVAWSAGEHQIDGVRWRLAIEHDRVTLTQAE